MREALKEMLGRRETFYATFTGQTRTKSYREHVNEMHLLTHICTRSGRELTDHLYMWDSKAIQKLTPKAGDRLRFTATVSEYTKMYVNRDEDIRMPVQDYKLSYASGFEVVPQDGAPVDKGQLTLEML